MNFCGHVVWCHNNGAVNSQALAASHVLTPPIHAYHACCCFDNVFYESRFAVQLEQIMHQHLWKWRFSVECSWSAHFHHRLIFRYPHVKCKRNLFDGFALQISPPVLIPSGSTLYLLFIPFLTEISSPTTYFAICKIALTRIFGFVLELQVSTLHYWHSWNI